MKELDTLRLLRARTDNYTISSIGHMKGRLYSITMNGKHYQALLLTNSFSYYERRYHLARSKPTLVICYTHDTVLPLPVLSMRTGNYADAYELPEEVKDVEAQRHSKTGAQVILGMYLCGVRFAQSIIKDLPTSTRNRYLRKAKALGHRTRGRPSGHS